jgi:hypothetical protein
MKHRVAITLLSTIVLGGAGVSAQSPAATTSQDERFAAKVAEYEAEDRAHPPPKGSILFAGDSQFYRWKTIHEDLPGYTLINRGMVF